MYIYNILLIVFEGINIWRASIPFPDSINNQRCIFTYKDKISEYGKSPYGTITEYKYIFSILFIPFVFIPFYNIEIVKKWKTAILIYFILWYFMVLVFSVIALVDMNPVICINPTTHPHILAWEKIPYEMFLVYVPYIIFVSSWIYSCFRLKKSLNENLEPDVPPRYEEIESIRS
jgi:hypothetical protein